jgi:protein involved in polysaccharide export with SLBB domain
MPSARRRVGGNAVIGAGLVWTLLPGLLAHGAASPSVPEVVRRVRPGDVLEVTVAGRPDLSRLRTVQTTGAIWMPRLAEVPVEGLTPAEIAATLTRMLARYEPARPVVTVGVMEDREAFVRVAGAVTRPGRHKLGARRRLLDVLLEAGGFTAEASGAVLVERREGSFADGTSVRRVRLRPGQPTPAGLTELETVLHGGDVVTVSAHEYVTVKGAVNRPGRYTLQGDTTVTAAVSSAGGPTRFGGRHVRVDRRDPATGQVESLRADLEAIRKGREQDLLLLPDDSVEVEPRRL